MRAMTLLAPRERAAAALAAAVASLSLVAATLLVFGADGQTEWFISDSSAAAAATRCDETYIHSTQRHECLRQVAQARRASDAAPTRLAKR